MEGREGSDTSSQRCCECTDNTKALLMVIALFASITTAQLTAAVFASSDALLVDGLSMLVDTATYVGNLLAEFRGGSALSELLASGASLAVLYSVAMYGVVSAAVQLVDPQDSQDQLVPGIVLAFGLWGLLFDVLSFWGFHRWGLQSLVSGGAAGEEDDPHASMVERREAAFGEEKATKVPEQEEKASMNMRSAFMHVGADLLRSTATVVEGCVVLIGGYEGRTADAVATLAVSATIAAGGCGAGASWLREAWKMRYTRRRRKLGLPVPAVDSIPAAVIGAAQAEGGSAGSQDECASPTAAAAVPREPG